MMLPECPTCQSANSVRQAHKRNLDSFWRFFGWYAYRCDGCSERFYRFAKPKGKMSDAM
jgi:hypothetical protein